MSCQRIARENNTTKDHRDSSSHYYVPNARIKDFNVLIDGKNFFDLPVKNEEEAYEKIMDMSNNDYTTGNLLDFAYFEESYRLIAIDLSKQNKLNDPKRLVVLVSFQIRMEQQCFSSSKNQKKQLLIFHEILSQSYK